MSDELPLVSIILPILNEADYIERCLNAVLDQDYPNDNVEILIVDGMSTDGTRQIVQKFAASHLKIHLLDNPAGIVPTALNIGLRRAKGEVIIRVDGHCMIAPNYLRKCVERILGEGVDGVGGPMETIGETQMANAIAIAMSSPFGVGDSSFRTTSGKEMLVDTAPFPAYTRQIIERAGLYDEELVRDQDDEYNYRIRELGGKILLAADVNSKYFSRASLKGLWRQYFQYGFWKVRVLQKHPGQMRPRQFVPPLFILGILLSALCALVPVLRPLSPIIPGLYLLANLSASLLTASRRGWRALPFLPIVFAILHLSYGLGFLLGLVKFANRWGDRAGKVPAE